MRRSVRDGIRLMHCCWRQTVFEIGAIEQSAHLCLYRSLRGGWGTFDVLLQ